jgi:lysophospholipase L1-like esterase
MNGMNGGVLPQPVPSLSQYYTNPTNPNHNGAINEVYDAVYSVDTSIPSIASLPAPSPHLLFRETNGAFVNAGGTNETVSGLINLEAPASFVRLIHFNDQTGATGPIAGAYVSPTSGFGLHADDGYNPYNASGAQDNTMGVQVTYNNGGTGAGFNFFNQNSGSTTTATVPVASVDAGQPSVCYSDWIKVNGIPRIDGGPGALIQVRIASGVGGTFRYQAAAGIYKNNTIPGRAAAGYWQSGNTSNFASGAWSTPGPFGAFASPCALEYIAQASGLKLMCVGDSITSGNKSTGGYTSFGPLAAFTLTSAKFPVSYWSEGFSGRTTADFLANGYNFITALKPHVVTIQMWSENDPPSLAQAQSAFQSAMHLAKIAVDNNCIPILCTAAPVYAGNSTNEVFRVANNTLVRSAAAQGMLVLDLDTILGTGQSPNQYQAQYNGGDNTHPSDAGNAAVAAVLVEMILNLYGRFAP